MVERMTFRVVYTSNQGSNTTINTSVLMGVLSSGTLMNYKHNHVLHPTKYVSNTTLNMSVFWGMFLSDRGLYLSYYTID